MSYPKRLAENFYTKFIDKSEYKNKDILLEKTLLY